MASLYNLKREALSGSQKQNVSNINVEIEKVRSQSPVPLKRECKDGEKGERLVKKMAFKSDIDELKQKFDKVEYNLKSIQTDIKFNLEDTKKEMQNLVNDTLGEQKKYFDTLKIENLKNALNNSIKEINENLKNIASQLVNHLDSINELKIRVQDLEEMIE